MSGARKASDNVIRMLNSFHLRPGSTMLGGSTIKTVRRSRGRCAGAIFPTRSCALSAASTISARQSSLDRLVDADLLFVEGSGRQAIYRFKHALIQDAAYESLLRSRRQALHRCAAEILRDEPERAPRSKGWSL